MTVLLVGCGYWGRNWAKTLAGINELGAICEASPALHETLKQQFPDTPLYASLEESLAHPGIDCCVVATPVVTHYDTAMACLAAGKHVLAEKPMTLTVEESQALVRFAREQQRLLAVGHLLMYHPALLKLQELIHNGQLGEVRSIHCTRVNLGKVRNEEDCWESLAPHDLSILSMLLEEPFTLQNATPFHLLNRPDIADAVHVAFQTPSGKAATIHVSWLSPVKRHETVVIGTQKIAVFEDTRPLQEKLMLLDYTLDWEGNRAQSIERGEAQYVPLAMPEELLAMEARAFLHAAENRLAIQNDGENGLQVVEMLDAVKQWMRRQTPCAVG